MKKKLRTSKKKEYINSKIKVKTKIKWIENNYIKDKEGFYLGPLQKYFLSHKALNHIINGDYSYRLLRSNTNDNRDKELILKGGLHTYNAWINFKNKRSDIVHLREYNSNTDKYWYYARELKNGVITLRIPNDVFQSRAAKITQYPETYYKSGFLWKTLFPKGKTEKEIISMIDEALYKVHKEESTESEIYGYALTNHPYTAIKIRIQCRGNDIYSAFPSWEQPYIGNTGKAYSHIDTIGFFIADSTEFFDDKSFPKFKSKIYLDDSVSLLLTTPKFLLERKKLPNYEDSIEWRKEREKTLINVAKAMSLNEAKYLITYLQDPFILKDGFQFQLWAYNIIYHKISKNNQLFNAVLIHYNIFESIQVLYYYDNQHKTNFFKIMVKHLLINKINYTIGIDTWQNKILHTKILELLSTYHDYSIIIDYVNLLSQSPTRVSLFLEFDIPNCCYKWEIDTSIPNNHFNVTALMNLPSNEYILTPKCYNKYFELMLSENYFFGVNKNKREKLIRKIHTNQGKQFEQLVNDTIKLSVSKDFIFFAEHFSNLINKVIERKILDINPISISRIVKDFFRLQRAQRIKIIIKNHGYNSNYIEDYDEYSDEYISNSIIKHERSIPILILIYLLENIEKLAIFLNNSKMKLEVEKYLDVAWEERTKYDNRIPRYINHWYNSKDKSWKETLDNVYL